MISWSRRGFLAACSAAIALPAAQLNAKRPMQRNRVIASFGSVQFAFEGLCAAKFDEAGKTITAVLPDAAKVSAGSMMKLDPHSALMMVPYSDYLAPSVQTPDDFNNPVVLKINGVDIAIWSIAGYSVWIHDAHDRFETDASANLVFPMTVTGSPTAPSPLADDAAWADRYWMVKLKKILNNQNITIKHPDWLPTQVKVTRGTAKCLKPLLPCEQQRLYKFGMMPAQAFTTRFAAEYPSAGATVTLAIVATSELSSANYRPQFIRLRAYNGLTTNVTVTNLSHGHDPTNKHFKAFYSLVDEMNGPEIELLGCQLFKIEGTDVQSSGLPDSPNPFCIPPEV